MVCRRRSIQAATLRLGLFIMVIGFLGFTAGLYAALQNSGDERVFPNLTIFAAPRPFAFSAGLLDLVGRRQELAVRSWLDLAPYVSVVLFGKDAYIFDLARILGPRVTVDSDIDFTFVGTPFFRCMIGKSQKLSSAISVVFDPETVLLPNILTAMHCAYKLDRDWFLVSMIPSISNFPFHIVDWKHWLKEDGEIIRIKKLREYVIKELQWNCCSKKLLMAWSTGIVPLYAGIIPPFSHGRGFHDSWVLHEVLSSEFRLVIDCSYIKSATHPEYKMGYFKRSISSNTITGGWEVRINHHLTALYGSIYSGEQDVLTTNLIFIKFAGKHVFLDSIRMVVLQHDEPSGHHVAFKHGMTFFFRQFLHIGTQQKYLSCIKDINFLESQCSLKQVYDIAVPKALAFFNPLNLESLLQMIADEHKTVILAVAGENYRDMLMSWVCRLRYLNISNFIICALDAETYQFALLMGLPVFRDPLAPSNISFNDCHFGTECFKRVTKVKSRVVLQILKLGYNVLLSDVDVYWFSNPLVYLQSFDPAILVAQSDEYNETGPINLSRRLNSGFYFSRSDPATIAAMEMVVKHASISTLSEQPSFYDVLCGKDGVNRVDDSHCLEPNTNLTIHFLDRNLFPNGAYKGLWEKRNVRASCKKQGCIILHNNWISGRKRKLERQVHSGLWEYDPARIMCLRSWHRTSPTSHFI